MHTNYVEGPNALHIKVASLAQWLELSAVNRKVTGSNPVGSDFIFITFASPSNKTIITTLKLNYDNDRSQSKKCYTNLWSSDFNVRIANC